MAYVLRGRKGGTVRFIPLENGVIEKESESYSSSVTSNPVEDGADIDDHVNNAAGTLNISGTIVGGDAAINALPADPQHLPPRACRAALRICGD